MICFWNACEERHLEQFPTILHTFLSIQIPKQRSKSIRRLLVQNHTPEGQLNWFQWLMVETNQNNIVQSKSTHSGELGSNVANRFVNTEATIVWIQWALPVGNSVLLKILLMDRQTFAKELLKCLNENDKLVSEKDTAKGWYVENPPFSFLVMSHCYIPILKWEKQVWQRFLKKWPTSLFNKRILIQMQFFPVISWLQRNPSVEFSIA